MEKISCVVLQVVDGEEGYMATYEPQLATIQEYDSLEDAACLNVGTYPDFDKKGKPYRVIVIPEKSWNEFEVFGESIKGTREFKAYPSEHRTIS